MKKMNLLGPLFGLALMAAASVYAEPDPNFHIYLAFGQSNMEGQGTIESQDKTVDPRFQMLSTIDNFNGRKLGTWNDAIPPLANKHGGLGPTDYFGRTLVEKLDPQIKVGVVVVAIAGCSIVAFDSPLDQGYMSTQAGWFKDIVNDYGGDPYQRLVDMAKKAKEDGVIKGIIFHQGETDEGDSDWPNKVKKVYDRLVRDIGLDENIPFLTEKPVIYMFNVDENGLTDADLQEKLRALVAPSEAIFVNAKLEEEMSGMDRDERKEFLESYGVKDDALGELIKAAYKTLRLQSFLTAGKKECRAWTIKQGATAPEAAGTIHTDFERGFIAANICNFADLKELGSEQAVKAAGKLRTEGKAYVMQDGDVVEFKFNV